MNRSDGQGSTNAAASTNAVALRQRIEQELAGAGSGTMLRARLAKVLEKHGLSATTYQYLQVAGKLARREGEDYDLAAFARHHGPDLTKCGPELHIGESS